MCGKAVCAPSPRWSASEVQFRRLVSERGRQAGSVNVWQPWARHPDNTPRDLAAHAHVRQGRVTGQERIRPTRTIRKRSGQMLTVKEIMQQRLASSPEEYGLITNYKHHYVAVNAASVTCNLTRGLYVLLCCFSSIKMGGWRDRPLQNNVHYIKTFPLKLPLLFSFQVAVKIIDKTQLNSSSLQKVGPTSTFTLLQQLDVTCVYLRWQMHQCHNVRCGGKYRSNTAIATTMVVMDELKARLVNSVLYSCHIGLFF